MVRHLLARSFIGFGLTALILSPAAAQIPNGDLLLYYGEEAMGIRAYDPAAGETHQLPSTGLIDTLVTSGDGRIAYVQDNDVWVLDVLHNPDNPTKITQTPYEQESFLNWTPDGRLLQYRVGALPGPYLLYTYDGSESIAVEYGYGVTWHWNKHGWYAADEPGDGRRLSIWNGNERLNLVLPALQAELPWQRFFQWTPDNHLIITVSYQEPFYAKPIGATEVFYWNGMDVQRLDSPSNPGSLMIGDWSPDGRLTLFTRHEGFDQWYIWDGSSFTPEGFPDLSGLLAINGPAETISDIEWMPDGQLAIVAEGQTESGSLLGHPFRCPSPCKPQVYIWNSQGLHQLTDNDLGGLLVDVQTNGSIAVSDFDGIHIWNVTVFDSSFQPIFRSEAGPYSLSQWSSDGNLAYCMVSGLHVWNGQNAIPLRSSRLSRWLIASTPPMDCYNG